METLKKYNIALQTSTPPTSILSYQTQIFDMDYFPIFEELERFVVENNNGYVCSPWRRGSAYAFECIQQYDLNLALLIDDEYIGGWINSASSLMTVDGYRGLYHGYSGLPTTKKITFVTTSKYIKKHPKLIEDLSQTNVVVKLS